jgi:hypothetical protein
MTTQAVHESVRLLPPDSVAYGPKTQPLEAHQRWAAGVNDPHWAWRIAFGYYQSQEPLPPSIRDQNIRRAYRYLQGNRDDQMAMALAIRISMESGMIREVLQGLLCARDISLEGIASLLGLDPDVVSLFEGLFFNVRNREVTFALNTIFPQTRLGAVREAELDYNEVDLTLMRAGRDYGWKDVARLAGLLTIEDGDESPETMLADVEKTIAANARMLARAGHLNRPNSAGIRHGKSLMLPAKKQAEMNNSNDPDSRLGLGSFGMKAAVLEHFRRITDTDSQYRLALQREAAMGQIEKTATAAKAE